MMMLVVIKSKEEWGLIKRKTNCQKGIMLGKFVPIEEKIKVWVPAMCQMSLAKVNS